MQGHTAIMSDLNLSECGKIVTSSYDRTIKVWDSKTGLLLRYLLSVTYTIFFKHFGFENIC